MSLRIYVKMLGKSRKNAAGEYSACIINMGQFYFDQFMKRLEGALCHFMEEILIRRERYLLSASLCF